VKDVAVGVDQVVVVTADGDVYGWGQDDAGLMGKGVGPGSGMAGPVPLLQGRNIVGVACGPGQVGISITLKLKVLDADAIPMVIWDEKYPLDC